MASIFADKPRTEPRVRAMVRARLRDDAGEREMCIIDVSTRGLLATAARPPVRGDYVEVTIGRNSLTAQVKWSGERRFGLSLRERVSVAAMIEGGAGTVALASSVGMARRRQSHWAALRDMPQMLGRMGQYGLMLFAVVVAAFLLMEVVSSGFEPMRNALESR